MTQSGDESYQNVAGNFFNKVLFSYFRISYKMAPICPVERRHLVTEKADDRTAIFQINVKSETTEWNL